MHIFLTALMFFTRIPVPATLPYSNDLLNKALRFFPLVGGIVGGIGAGSLWLGLLIFPFPLALLLSMLVTIFVTGAFHEDGFADFCDGYGGGLTKEKVLEIMKDSRLGTYGTMGLTAMLATKFMTLSHLSTPLIFLVMVAAHMVSRFMPVLLVYTTPYIREDGLSKAKPIGNQTTKTSVVIALVTALIPLLFLSWPTIICIGASSALVLWLFRAYILKRTGGYSGDVLGALQQLVEVTFYLVVLALQFP